MHIFFYFFEIISPLSYNLKIWDWKYFIFCYLLAIFKNSINSKNDIYLVQFRFLNFVFFFNDTGCRSLDLVFATSVPNSVPDWTLARTFLNEFLNFMPVGSSSVRVSLVTYDLYTANNPFWLNSYYDKEALKLAIDSIPESRYSYAQSNPTLALVNIRTKVILFFFFLDF